MMSQKNLITIAKKNKMKKLLLLFMVFFISSNIAIASEPTTISTFQSIGIYWSPVDGSRNSKVFVKFREEGTSTWQEGLPMKYNPIKNTEEDIADYRGSIVNLKSGTNYEIGIALEASSDTARITASTWTEDFPIGQTISINDRNSTLPIIASGTENGYLLIDGTGSTIDVNNEHDFCITIDASYVIIRGFNLRSARKHGVNINDGCHDIIIEDCDISNWGQLDDEGLFGENLDAGINGDGESIERIVIQRCKIHDPRTDANSLAELHNGGYHPSGPQAIVFVNNNGNHVIRYNEIWSDYDHMFNDVIGGATNGSYRGFPGPDSDIYGNYFSNCWDDGIETEGGNRNVRIWNNFIDSTFIAIGNAATSIGPLYIWKNTTNYSYNPPDTWLDDYNGHEVDHGAWIKMGYASSIAWMTGHMYLFNNTILQQNGEGHGGTGVTNTDNRYLRHCVTRNNVFQSRRDVNSISIRSSSDNIDNDFNYDLFNNGVPNDSESHGIHGTPTYESGSGWNYSTMTAQFNLESGTLGHDAGEVIPNFADKYEGAAPDMGAFENGEGALVYGVKADPTVGVYEKELVEYPSRFELYQNYPNPFNPTTKIQYSIIGNGHAHSTTNVKLKIYDILGREVATLVNKQQKAGNYEVHFNASNLTSGIYFYRLQSGSFVESKKMILTK